MANTYQAVDEKKLGKEQHLYLIGGKYYEKNGRIVLPLSVQAHHSFVDGIPIEKFANCRLYCEKDLRHDTCFCR